MCIRVGENDVNSARANAASGAGTCFPVVVPADDVLDGVRILISVIGTGVGIAVERAVAVFVKWRRKLVPVFSKTFVAGVLGRPHREPGALVYVEHLAAVFGDAAVEHLARSDGSPAVRI